MVWLLVGLVCQFSGWAQYFGYAQGGTASVSAWGTEALGANPAGMLRGEERWEVGLLALSAELSGLTLREYAFYFGGVEGPSGWQPRRLGKEERVQGVRLFEERPLSFYGRSELLAGLWRLTPEHAFGFSLGSQVWCRWQLLQGSSRVAQYDVLGADTVELQGGHFSLRLYSVATAGYARRVWGTVVTADTASPWHRGELTGGVAVHVYRGHVYGEQVAGGWLRVVPFVPALWDSTVNWAVTVLQSWRWSDSRSPWWAMVTGVAPAVGWGAGMSVGACWSWYGFDSVETATVALSLEQVGVLRWSVTEFSLERENDTVGGILGSAATQLSTHYTPRRQASAVTEWMPPRLRIGGAIAVSALGVGVPVRLSGELSYVGKQSWNSQELSWGGGLLWLPPSPWLPWIGCGGIWSPQTRPRVTAGLRWIVPPAGRFRMVLELTTTSLLGWVFRQRVARSAVGVRLWMRF